MRVVHLSGLVLTTLTGVALLSCSEGAVDTMDISEAAQTGMPGPSGLPTAGPHLAGATPTTGSTTAMPSSTSSTSGPSEASDTGPGSDLGGGPGDDDDPPASTNDAGSGPASGSTPEPSDDGPSEPSPPLVECSDEPPDDRHSCSQWAEWGECDNPNQWLADFCDLSCGRCQPGMSIAPRPGAGDPGSEAPGSEAPESGAQGGNQELGNDNPFPPINGGQQGHSTRYWDCCKASCGWSNRPNAVDSCDLSGNNIGVNDQRSSVCPDGAGDAQTCHGMAPWAHSTTLSFGYAAVSQAACGTCWQLQFTGSGPGGNAGAAALAGKTMVVMATNTGSDVGAGQFDLLIPGGGVGIFNGCTRALGIQASEMGAQYGGFRTQCASAGDQNAIKQCVRDMCTNVFGSRGFGDLEQGCLWYVDWFEAADNPDFVYQEVPCPQELREYN